MWRGATVNNSHFRKRGKAEDSKEHNGFQCLKRLASLACVKINTFIEEDYVLFPRREVPFTVTSVLFSKQKCDSDEKGTSTGFQSHTFLAGKKLQESRTERLLHVLRLFLSPEARPPRGASWSVEDHRAPGRKDWGQRAHRL